MARMKIASLFVGLIALAVAQGGPAMALDEVVGWARAVDGDTIKIKSIDDGKTHQVRLYGVAAPDARQHCETQNGESIDCGLMSLDALDAIMRKKRITCVDVEKGVDGTLAGICYAGDRIINSTLVRAGWALAYTEESSDYLGLEELARGEGKGIWPYRFEKPWIWREQQKKAKKSD